MLGERLKQLRKGKGITQSALAEELGITQQAVGKWETGRSSPDPDMLLRLAEYFCVSIDSLLGREGILGRQVLPYVAAGEVQIPVLGEVRAGYGALASEAVIGTETATVRDPENYFYLVVKGDSMEPRIHEGDLALVRRQQTLDDGALGVVVHGENEGTIKKFLRKGNAVVLQPFNATYDTLILSGEELDHIYIAGKVVETKTCW